MNNERKKDNVIGKTVVSKNVHILIPPNWEWVTLPGKRYFADVTHFKQERVSWNIQVGPM